jgi:hypothetical protein
MINYEVWSVTYSFATRQAEFATDSPQQAMKHFIRNLNKIFYYDCWKENHNAYVVDGTLYVVTRSTMGKNYKQTMLDSAYDIYLKAKQPSRCDCGSEKVYGKSGAHSHWCSTRG